MTEGLLAYTRRPGWGKPDRARKWHYFPAHRLTSVCGAWRWGWPRSDKPLFHGTCCKRCEEGADHG